MSITRNFREELGGALSRLVMAGRISSDMAHMVSDLYNERYRADPQSLVSLLARLMVSQKEPTSSPSRSWEMVVLVLRQTC